jgi:hypothetical protein
MEPGITLDKYFGCNFTVVKPDLTRFDEEFVGKGEDVDRSI